MGKKKKKNTESQPTPAAKGPFNNPFTGLKKELKRLTREPATPPPPPPPPKAAEPPEPDDLALLARAMQGVRPVESGRPGIVPTPAANPQPRFSSEPDEELEVMAHLADLVAGEGDFDMRFTAEYVSGHQPGVGPELLRRVAEGDFPMQAYLDLHGLGEDEAQVEVERFIVESATKGLRHVVIVHGRGYRSPGGVPVLKTALTRWLKRKSMRHWVLAFCTAQARDGGFGAMYVLLRRWSGPGAFPRG